LRQNLPSHLALPDVEVNPVTGEVTEHYRDASPPRGILKYWRELLLALSIVTVCPLAGVVGIHMVGAAFVPPPTHTPTPLPTVGPTSTPVPTPTPSLTPSPTPVPTELFQGYAYVWAQKDDEYDNQFSVPGDPTGVRAWVCWTGTAKQKDGFEIIVKLVPTCATGINTASMPAWNGIAISASMAKMLGMDVKKYKYPHIVVFSLSGGVLPGWEVVDQ